MMFLLIYPYEHCTFVTYFLSSMDGTESTGMGCIGPRLLKVDPKALSPSITFIINKSITSGVFPSIWKHAKVNHFSNQEQKMN